MGTYNFSLLGHCMSARMKIIKHVRANNPDRVKDYICRFYDTFDPRQLKDHPLWEDIEAGLRVLKRQGWTAYTGVWKDAGVQLIIKDPAGNCYRSHYRTQGDK